MADPLAGLHPLRPPPVPDVGAAAEVLAALALGLALALAALLLWRLVSDGARAGAAGDEDPALSTARQARAALARIAPGIDWPEAAHRHWGAEAGRTARRLRRSLYRRPGDGAAPDLGALDARLRR